MPRRSPHPDSQMLDTRVSFPPVRSGANLDLKALPAPGDTSHPNPGYRRSPVPLGGTSPSAPALSIRDRMRVAYARTKRFVRKQIKRGVDYTNARPIEKIAQASRRSVGGGVGQGFKKGASAVGRGLLKGGKVAGYATLGLMAIGGIALVATNLPTQNERQRY